MKSDTTKKSRNITLNDKQHNAITHENKQVLVLAGAGSGKTETLLQKINYLIEHKGVAPSSILAITFSHNAANEIIDRLILSVDKTGKYQEILNAGTNIDKERTNFQRKYKWIDRLTVKTFHSFCYAVLRSMGVNEFDNKFKIITNKERKDKDDLAANASPETAPKTIQKLIIELCDDAGFLIQFKRYILDHHVNKIHIERDVPSIEHQKYYTSFDGTEVRSKSEQFIADWLYRHDIKYEYEPKLSVTTKFSFQPDFYIPEANMYLEHVSDISYPTKHKEREFEQGNMFFAKTCDSMTKDTRIFNRTLDRLVKNRLPTGHKATSPLRYNEEFDGYHDHVKRFISNIIQVIDRYKADNLKLETVLENGQKDQHERVQVFYQLADIIINRYLDYCVKKSYLDFNDLISRTVSLFTKSPDILNKYKDQYQYILVDEFQDVNNLQVALIQLLLNRNSQLFCVGDDWQSIYGFRGSNVDFIINFTQSFPNAEIIKLNTNYRSTQHIVKASNDVIAHNKYKVDKDIQSSRQPGDKITVFGGNCEDDNIEFCANKVWDLLENGLQNDDILFLFRTHQMAEAYAAYFKEQGLKPQFKTIHSSKGLQAKAVFILGLTEGKGGFPNVWFEDRILNVIKEANYNLLLEEERRVFYVSITRAKDQLFLITEKGNESSFIKEISAELLERQFSK
uniref:UvrD-helicase domain-containing protein n=1 Tax=Pedobacter schmidteae TaxID=2201271 RepID=UPI000EB5B964|nr:UvrD-helicase domain-containing protein [Pedobacter schmidteae]